MKYLIIVLTLVLSSCTTTKDEIIESPNGFWEEEGYGKIVEIRDSIIRVYDICNVDCHLAFEEEILDFGRITKVSKDSLIIKHNIDDWKFYRIKGLPKLCLDSPKEKYQDPIYNFDTYWHTFNEHYCSFGLKNVDWDSVYKKYRAKVSNETSNLDLFLIFEEMNESLNDGHIDIELPEELEEAYKNTQVKKQKRYSNLDEFDLHKELAELYVDSLRNYNGGVVRWGMIEEEVGYIQFNTMWMIGNHDIDPRLNLMETYNLYIKAMDPLKDEEQREDEEKGADYIRE